MAPSILDTTISRHVARGTTINGYLVTTRHTRYFITGEDANIVRLDMAFSASGQWRARAWYTPDFSYLCDWYSFAAHAADDHIPMTFKNGKPLYYLGDYDHGYNRIQGEGVTAIRRAIFSRQPDGYWLEDRT